MLSSELSGAARALVDDLKALREGLDPARATVAYALDPAKSSLLVRTGSAGLFSAFGHDHELGAKTFSAHFDVDERDVFRSKVAFTVDATSFHVVDKESADDAKEIEANMNNGVLESARFPKIEFASTGLALRQGEPAERGLAAFAGKEVEVTLTGELTLHGQKRTVRIPGKLKLERDLLRVRGEFALKQTDYGMTPYSAVGGAVKVEDKLRVVYDFQAPREKR
ncbi:MAG: YceI family protein [Planctomycetes bacterium]|nr:YceI family protein [Planctomycetota bacterium]